MLRYDLEQIGITNDYYIIDNFKDEDDGIVSMVTGYDFAKPIVDLLNNDDDCGGLVDCDRDDASSMSLLNFRNFLLSVSKDFTDEELKGKKVFIKSNNGFYHDFKALEGQGGDFCITFLTVPSFIDKCDDRGLLDYSSYLDTYCGYDDMSYEAFMISEAYNSLKSDSDCVELLDVDGVVIGRFCLHDSLTITDSYVIINKDCDVAYCQGYDFSYIVDFKEIYSLSF